MTSPDENPNKVWRWIRWFLFSEGLILLLALAGPGRRGSAYRRDNHDLLAGWFIDDPSYLQAVIVNLIAIHIFIGSVFVAAWMVTRWRDKS